MVKTKFKLLYLLITFLIFNPLFAEEKLEEILLKDK